MRIDPSTLDACFADLERAACAGERCPENGTYHVNSHSVAALASAGRIVVKISGRNYRQVFLLVGRHAGKFTAPDPSGARVWKILDTKGAHIFSVERSASKRRQPSLPRPLAFNIGSTKAER